MRGLHRRGVEIAASIRADFIGPPRVHSAGTSRLAWSKSMERGARNLRSFRRDFPLTPSRPAESAPHDGLGPGRRRSLRWLFFCTC